MAEISTITYPAGVKNRFIKWKNVPLPELFVATSNFSIFVLIRCKKMKKTYIILGILVIGILAGTTIFISEWNRKPRNVRETVAAYSLTTAELLDAFKKDTAVAAQKFNDNIIKVTGAVNWVEESDSARRINATFNGDSIDLIATFKKSENKNFASIKPGNTITFKGEYIGLEVDDFLGLTPAIRMDKCVLEDK